MTKYDIKLYCKDKKTLKKIFKFLSLQYNTEIKKLQTPLYFNQKKTKIKKITVLKSPHVNKSAQRHFEYRIYSIKIQVCSYKPQKYLFVLKKLQNYIFPEVKITIKQKINQKNNQKLIENNFLNPDNYRTELKLPVDNQQQKLKYKKNMSSKKRNYFNLNNKFFEKTVLYIKMFDYYGNVQ